MASVRLCLPPVMPAAIASVRGTQQLAKNGRRIFLIRRDVKFRNLLCKNRLYRIMNPCLPQVGHPKFSVTLIIAGRTVSRVCAGEAQARYVSSSKRMKTQSRALAPSFTGGLRKSALIPPNDPYLAESLWLEPHDVPICWLSFSIRIGFTPINRRCSRLAYP